MSKVVVCFSGGMDSYTLLHGALDLGHKVQALSFDYRQRHVVELGCASAVCARLDVPHITVDIGFLHQIGSNSALTHGLDVPEGHYSEESMKKTVVPNRNMILTAIAVAHAVNIEYDMVWLAQHSGDHAIYPDCRPEFVSLMNQAAHIANWHPVEVHAPFIDLDKHGILTFGMNIGLRAEDYAETWTCYQPRLDGKACGKCGSCTERLEAFQLMGWRDPVEYAQ